MQDKPRGWLREARLLWRGFSGRRRASLRERPNSSMWIWRSSGRCWCWSRPWFGSTGPGRRSGPSHFFGRRRYHRQLSGAVIRKGVDLPLLLILAGVIGGLIAFGVIGLFIGSVIL